MEAVLIDVEVLLARKRYRVSERESDRFQYTERDLLIQLRQDLKNFIASAHETETQSRAALKDHEGRIRVLENFRWWIIGASVAGGFAGNLAIRLLFPTHS